jgi:hypothetical protein
MIPIRCRAFISCLAAVLIGGCDESQAPGGGPGSGPHPDQILHDFQVAMTRGELKTAVFTASKGVVYLKRDSMLVETLTAELFDSEGAYSSTLWADSGLIRERQKKLVAHGHVRLQSRDSVHLTSDSLFWYGELVMAAPESSAGEDSVKDLRYMVAKGRVHLITRDGAQLWTDTLLWNDIRQQVSTDALVTIVDREGDTLRGSRLRSDDQLRKISLEKSSGRFDSDSR